MGVFYIKKTFADENETVVEVPIEDSTIYTRCPFCGEEIETDLHSLVKDDFDFESTCIFCDNCTSLYKHFKEG